MTLSLRSVSVTYGAVVAVDGVDLDVADGEVLALLGPSGCGKSTLLRAIAGLEPLAEGSVHWNGHDLSTVAVHERQIGVVFQSHALFPHRDVGDNVAFGLRMHGVGRADRRRRVHEMLDLVGLSGAEARRVDTLSGGQAQRVALARALAPGPDLLLLDEPLAALDQVLRERLVGEIRRIVRDAGVTAVHVTHDLDEAATVGDRVAIMEAGRIRRTGVLDAIVAEPGDVATATLLGLDTIWVCPLVGSPEGEWSAGTPLGRLPLDVRSLDPIGMGTVPDTGAPHPPTVSLWVPPGAVRIDHDATADRGWLHGTAVVRSGRRRGNEWLATLMLDNGTDIVVGRPHRPAEGTRIDVAIDPQRIQLLTRT